MLWEAVWLARPARLFVADRKCGWSASTSAAIRKSAATRTTKKVEPVSGETCDDDKVLEGLDDYLDGNAICLRVEGTEFKQHLYELLE